MKIAIIGHGKMGRMIEEIASRERGHEIVSIIDEHNPGDFDSPEFLGADVAIEFTRPEAGAENVRKCLQRGVAVVSGTTGWNDRLAEMQELCRKEGGSLLWASNYSIGVNIFRVLSKRLADMMRGFPQYRPSLTETHHIHKLDHPSGTAVTLAEDLIAHTPGVTRWSETEAGAEVLPVTALREGEVPGIHTITWESEADTIGITHSAKSRRGFALGAVLAAEWLAANPGVHDITEMYSNIE